MDNQDGDGDSSSDPPSSDEWGETEDDGDGDTEDDGDGDTGLEDEEVDSTHHEDPRKEEEIEDDEDEEGYAHEGSPSRLLSEGEGSDSVPFFLGQQNISKLDFESQSSMARGVTRA